MVGVGVECAVAAEGEDDVGAEGADAGNDVRGEGGERLLVELAVLVVEDFGMGDAEDFAGGGELSAAELAELFVGGGTAAIAAGGAGGEAEDGGFDAAIGGEGEGAPEGEAFVVGVGDDEEEL